MMMIIIITKKKTRDEKCSWKYAKQIKRFSKYTKKYLERLTYSQRPFSIVLQGGRSNRAKRSCLVSSHARKNKDRVVTDKHGNADGSEFDLGVDGAFKVFKIIVFQFYHIW